MGAGMDKKRGRPRSVETEKAILTAAYDLLLELGFADVTVEKIADRAQVSKATIYKWWPNKAAVVTDSYLNATTEKLQVPDTGSAVTDITLQASRLAAFLDSKEGRVINELIAEGQFDSALAETYRARYFVPRRIVSHEILERGVKRGELRSGLDIELCLDLIYGPIFYRLLITGEPVDDAFVGRIISYAMNGIRA